MKRVGAYVALGALFYLAFLVATAPAAWVAQGALRLTDGMLLLVRPAGTLWHGTGELHAGNGAGGVHEIGTLRWRLNPLPLVLGAAELDLRIDGPGVRVSGVMRRGLRYVQARDFTATAPAALASVIYGPVAFFDPRGTLTLRATRLELSSAGLITDAELRWDGAGGRFTGEHSLGDYRLRVNGTGPKARLDLSTVEGDLELAGQGEWQVAGSGMLRFTASATPRGGVAELEPLLRALGPDRGDGRRDIRLVLRLPLVQMLGF